MKCQQARRLISDRLDAPLTPAEGAALAAHLQGCAECARYERDLGAQMGRIARLPEFPLRPPAPLAAPPPAGIGPWLTRGAQALAIIAVVLLVARLTADLLRPRAVQLGGPAPTAVVAQISAAPASAAPASPERLPFAITAPATPASGPAQAIRYDRELTLDQQDTIWAQLAAEYGETIGALLRPGYLPEGMQKVQVGHSNGRCAIFFSGADSRQLMISVGVQPTELIDPATLGGAARDTTTVRGQVATLIAPQTPTGKLILHWDEPGRWAATGGLFGAGHIPYAIEAVGLSRADIERTAASLVPQTTATVAQDVVRRFYGAINARDYRTAYALFDPSWGQTYEEFAAGFADTARDDLDILGVIAAPTPGRYFVQVRLSAARTDGTRQWYSGTYQIGGAPGDPRIVAADVAALTEEQARQLVANVPPGCTDAQIGLIARPQRIEEGRVVDILIGVTNSGPTCRLAAPLQIALVGTDGQPLALEGNVQVLVPSGTLGTENLGLVFGWTNWCGAVAPATLRATLGDDTIAAAIEQPPACADRAAPSRLTRR